MTFPLKQGYALKRVFSFKNEPYCEAVCEHPNGSTAWVRTPVQPADHGICVMCRSQMRPNEEEGTFVCTNGHAPVFMDTRLDSRRQSRPPLKSRVAKVRVHTVTTPFNQPAEVDIDAVKQEVADALRGLL